MRIYLLWSDYYSIFITFTFFFYIAYVPYLVSVIYVQFLVKSSFSNGPKFFAKCSKLPPFEPGVASSVYVILFLTFFRNGMTSLFVVTGCCEFTKNSLPDFIIFSIFYSPIPILCKFWQKFRHKEHKKGQKNEYTSKFFWNIRCKLCIMRNNRWPPSGVIRLHHYATFCWYQKISLAITRKRSFGALWIIRTIRFLFVISSWPKRRRRRPKIMSKNSLVRS